MNGAISDATSTVDVVVVNWNSGEHLARALASLLAGERPDSPLCVVVVDNASSDRVLQLACQARPGVKVVANQRDVGFAAACNQGFQSVSADFILCSLARIFVDAMRSVESTSSMIKDTQERLVLAFQPRHRWLHGHSAWIVYSGGSSRHTSSPQKSSRRIAKCSRLSAPLSWYDAQRSRHSEASTSASSCTTKRWTLLAGGSSRIRRTTCRRHPRLVPSPRHRHRLQRTRKSAAEPVRRKLQRLAPRRARLARSVRHHHRRAVALQRLVRHLQSPPAPQLAWLPAARNLRGDAPSTSPLIDRGQQTGTGYLDEMNDTHPRRRGSRASWVPAAFNHVPRRCRAGHAARRDAAARREHSCSAGGYRNVGAPRNVRSSCAAFAEIDTFREPMLRHRGRANQHSSDRPPSDAQGPLARFRLCSRQAEACYLTDASAFDGPMCLP